MMTLGKPISKFDDRIVSDGNLKSELLSKQFSRVFTKEDLTDIPTVGSEPKPSIGSLTVSIAGVIKQVQSLKPHKAIGVVRMRHLHGF